MATELLSMEKSLYRKRQKYLLFPINIIQHFGILIKIYIDENSCYSKDRKIQFLVQVIQAIVGAGGEDMPSDKELINNLIDLYSILQQVKQGNDGHENRVLEYQIKVVTAKLSSMGVNVEDITL